MATDPRAEAEAKVPYKGTRLEGPIESEFLYATLLSTDLLPFGHFDFRPIVLPLFEDTHGYVLLSAQRAHEKGFLRLGAWLERAQIIWTEKRLEKAARMDILGRLNLQNGLTGQSPKADFVVIYPKSATFLCAAVVRAKGLVQEVGAQSISMKRFLADYVTFYWETDDESEAHYVTSAVYSKAVDDLIKPMQARGLWGPRDITKKVWELPIPQYRPDDSQHARLVQISESAEQRVKKMLSHVREKGSIGHARSAVRDALKEEIAEIDTLVRKLLK